jgi:hypothetical protein
VFGTLYEAALCGEPLPLGTTLTLRFGVCGPLVGALVSILCWGLSCRKGANRFMEEVPFAVALLLAIGVVVLLTCYALPIVPHRCNL